MLLRLQILLLLAALLGVPALASAADDPMPVVTTTKEVDALDQRTQRLRLRLSHVDREAQVLTERVTARLPELREVVLVQQAGQFSPRVLGVLTRAGKLRSLNMIGDASVSDETCVAMGRLTGLTELRLSLP